MWTLISALIAKISPSQLFSSDMVFLSIYFVSCVVCCNDSIKAKMPVKFLDCGFTCFCPCVTDAMGASVEGNKRELSLVGPLDVAVIVSQINRF